MTNKIAIQIHAADNVVTVVEEVSAGDVVEYMTPQGLRQIAVVEAVPMGHKVALDDIAAGERILKYNQPIGTSSSAIGRGGHVHAQNVTSAVQGKQHEN